MKKGIMMILLSCFLGGAAMQAQEKNQVKDILTGADHDAWKGLRFSYDRSILKSTADNSDLKQGFNGFTLSYVYAWHFTRTLPFFVEAGGGVNFWRHSYDASEDDVTLKTYQNILGLYIPVNVVYKIRVTDKIALKPYTGIYFRLGLLGKEKYESGVDGHTVSDSYNLYGSEGGDWKRFQMGWQIGLTADYGSYNFGIGYGIDFNEAAPEARFGSFSLRVGKNF